MHLPVRPGVNRIKAQFTALRYLALDGTGHASRKEQASMIRRYITWRGNHACDERLLRQAGAVYQFRHIELQHRLANEQRADPASAAPPRQRTNSLRIRARDSGRS